MLIFTISVIGLPVVAVWSVIDWLMILFGVFTDKDNKKVLEYSYRS